MTLRDFARFAQMHVQYGRFNNQQIVPSEWIDDIRCGGDKEAEGSCGGDKEAEGKCGEGKCGGDKTS